MRSKAPLALMEQLVMVLVFTLAAALCVQVFVLSDQTSRRNEARDRAVLEAQNAAEALKSVHGDFERLAELYGGTWNGQLWGRSYDENWEKDGGTAYNLLVFPADSGDPLLGRAEVMVYTAEGDLLASLPVAWQEAAEAADAAERVTALAEEMAALYVERQGDWEAVMAEYGGFPYQGCWVVLWDESWQQVYEWADAAYQVQITAPGQDGFGMASATVGGCAVPDRGDEMYCCFQITWQASSVSRDEMEEVADHG